MEFNLKAVPEKLKERIMEQIKFVKKTSKGRSRKIKTERIQYYKVTMEKDAPVLIFDVSIVNNLKSLASNLMSNCHDMNQVVKVENILRIIRCAGLKPEKVESSIDETKEFKEAVKEVIARK